MVDGHVHITERVFHEGIDPWEPQTSGQWDYARAKEGGVDVAIHTLWVEDEYNSYNYTVKQTCRLIERFYRVLEANPDKMELALSSTDVRRIVAKGKMAAILALEGGGDMEGDLDVIRLFYRLGVRMMQFTNHSTTNVLADAWPGEQKWKGITERGRAVIRELNRLGVLIDISHASEAAQFQIIEASQAPVVNSHTPGLRHFTSRLMAMSDDLLKALAARGGLMSMIEQGNALTQRYHEWEIANRPTDFGPSPQFTLFRLPDREYGEYISRLDTELHEKWVRKRGDRGGRAYVGPWRQRQLELIAAGAPLPTDGDWAAHVAFVVNLVGEDHVGIGMDMMSGSWSGLRDFDAASYPRLTEAMLAKGLSPTAIRKVLGENWLRLLDSAKIPAHSDP